MEWVGGAVRAFTDGSAELLEQPNCLQRLSGDGSGDSQVLDKEQRAFLGAVAARRRDSCHRHGLLRRCGIRGTAQCEVRGEFRMQVRFLSNTLSAGSGRKAVPNAGHEASWSTRPLMGHQVAEGISLEAVLDRRRFASVCGVAVQWRRSMSGDETWWRLTDEL